MGYIILDKDGGHDEMRHEMRRNMRGGYRYPMMRHGGEREDGYEHGYRKGYEHGWEDRMNEEDMGYRRRDSRGRFM